MLYKFNCCLTYNTDIGTIATCIEPNSLFVLTLQLLFLMVSGIYEDRFKTCHKQCITMLIRLSGNLIIRSGIVTSTVLLLVQLLMHRDS